MAIFKRHDEVQQQTAATVTETAAQAQAEAPAKLMPPFVSAPRSAAAAAGVVPPPAAPIYSMRPPESATGVEGDDSSVGTLVAEKVRTTSATQQSVQVAMRRSQSAARARRRQQAAPAITRTTQPVHQTFDAVRAAQAGLLNLAWSWQQAGSPIRAIHAYMQVLHRYPDTPAADAAVADLVEISDSLAQKGQFHIALAIYDELERLM